MGSCRRCSPTPGLAACSRSAWYRSHSACAHRGMSCDNGGQCGTASACVLNAKAARTAKPFKNLWIIVVVSCLACHGPKCGGDPKPVGAVMSQWGVDITAVADRSGFTALSFSLQWHSCRPVEATASSDRRHLMGCGPLRDMRHMPDSCNPVVGIPWSA